MPQYGELVFVPDVGGQSWIRGVCNGVDLQPGDEFLVGVPVGAHASGCQAILAHVDDYLLDWAFPEDMPSHEQNAQMN